jgi:hypothetical protein
MIICSLNIHGFGGPTKVASLKLLLQQIKLDIVFFQEMLVEGEKEKSLFLHCFPHWNVVDLDSHGCSEGLLSSWNPTYADFCDFGTVASILLEGRLKHSKETIKLLNCYAPYKDINFLATNFRFWAAL